MFKHRRSLPVFAGLIGAFTALLSLSMPPAGAASSSAFPVTLHLANGTVTIKAKPSRIVSLSPTATEMLYAIGAGSQVKAVDSYSDYPKGAPITKLSGLEPNVEAIAAYRPSLVVLSSDTTALNHQLTALGIAVVEEPAAPSLSAEYQQFTQLGAATGHATQAQREVASIKSHIARIVASTPRQSGEETYYYELDQTYYSETSQTFIGQLLGLLHLKSIADAASGAAKSGGYPQLSAEFILKSNPDYILLADTVCCGQSAKTVAGRPGWSNLVAVENHRVLGLNDDVASRWGPRVVTLLQQVATELREHPVSS